jgi:hypothetical protein
MGRVTYSKMCIFLLPTAYLAVHQRFPPVMARTTCGAFEAATFKGSVRSAGYLAQTIKQFHFDLTLPKSAHT